MELEPLKFQPKAASPATWAVVAQTLATLVVIFFASQLFVKQLDAIGPMLGLSAAVTALLLSPIATQLPEIMNVAPQKRTAGNPGRTPQPQAPPETTYRAVDRARRLSSHPGHGRRRRLGLHPPQRQRQRRRGERGARRQPAQGRTRRPEHPGHRLITPSLGDRETAAGVHWGTAGENIGEGGPVAETQANITGTAVGLTKGMLGEQPSNDRPRRNILNPNFHHTGITVLRDSGGSVWMTQDFSD
ncbi:hypothetical protein ACWGLF_06245 [Streptomyces puniciscabiei]